MSKQSKSGIPKRASNPHRKAKYAAQYYRTDANKRRRGLKQQKRLEYFQRRRAQRVVSAERHTDGG